VDSSQLLKGMLYNQVVLVIDATYISSNAWAKWRMQTQPKE
jgi:hypothetical protein